MGGAAQEFSLFYFWEDFWDSTGGFTIFLVDVNYNGEMTRNSREQDTQRVLGYPKKVRR